MIKINLFKVASEKDFLNTPVHKLRDYIVIGVKDNPISFKELITVVTLAHSNILKYEITNNKIKLSKNVREQYLIVRTHNDKILKYCKFKIGFSQKEEFKEKYNIENNIYKTEIGLIYDSVFKTTEDYTNNHDYLPAIISDIVDDFFKIVLYPIEVRLNKRKDLYDKYPMIVPDISMLDPSRMFYNSPRRFNEDRLYFYELCLNIYDDVLMSFKERIFNVSKNLIFALGANSNYSRDGILELYKFLDVNDLPFIERYKDEYGILKFIDNKYFAYILPKNNMEPEYEGIFLDKNTMLGPYEKVIRENNKQRYLIDVKIENNRIISKDVNKIFNILKNTREILVKAGLKTYVELNLDQLALSC